MRIVIIVETFTKNMGYIENILPKYLAKLGADVHVVSGLLPAYYYYTDFKETYSKFTRSNHRDVLQSEKLDGFTLHTLPVKRVMGYVKLQGLYKKIKDLKPDIIQINTAIGWIPLEAAFYKTFFQYKLFTGSHRSASTFPLAQRDEIKPWDIDSLVCLLTRKLPGRLSSLATEYSYCPTQDCAEIAWKFFGVQKHKVRLMFLGVDTDYFYPAKRDADSLFEVNRIRQELGFNQGDIVCVYSGKMNDTKNPKILAQAISQLRNEGKNFVGLFIGEGIQRHDIEKFNFCRTLDFMPYHEVAKYYRASDIAVWPTNESISMLDAAACGLPLIVSDGIGYYDHVEGNGLIYQMNNLPDLIDKLICLENSNVRRSLGKVGADKMSLNFSWEVVANKRISDYRDVLYHE